VELAVPALDERSLRALAQQIRVDAWTAEAIAALCSAGVECLLLKGPVIATWLYRDDPAQRPYIDADLLIAPGQLAPAHDVLVGLGYVRGGEPMPSGDRSHAQPYERARDRATIDVHRVPNGMQRLPEARAWAAMTRETEALHLAGVHATAPGEIARTLLLALHINPTNDRSSRAGRDLRRACTQLPDATWDAAATLARELGLEREMGYRLSLIAEAAALSERLGLPTAETAAYARYRTAEHDHPRGTLSLLAMTERTSPAARLRYATGKLFPPSEVLADRDPLAARSRTGLAAARVRWVARCVAWMPGAVRGWAANRPR
jgi:hypothetical protein